MTAYLVALILVITGGGPVVVTLKIPMVDMAACVAWHEHPEPYVVAGATRVRTGCEPIDPGKPV
jgi:hypothetical protein